MKLPLSVLRPLPRPLKPPPPLPPPPLPPPLPPPAASSWMSCACRDVMRRLPPSPLWPLKDGPPRLPPPRCMALPLCCCFALLRLVLVRLTRQASGLTRHEQAPWPLSDSGGVPIQTFAGPCKRCGDLTPQPCAGHASNQLRDPVVAPLYAMASLSALSMRPRCDAVAMRSSRRGEWRKSHQTTATGAAAMCYNTWPCAWPVGRHT